MKRLNDETRCDEICSRKIDGDGQATMSPDAKCYHATCSELTKLSSVYNTIKPHHCIVNVINSKTLKFCHNLLQDQILSNVSFNHMFHLLWQCYDHHKVRYQISIVYSCTIGKFNVWPYDGHNIVLQDNMWRMAL